MALLCEGLTNPQIAERLAISRAGARYHVSEILAKLGVATREEAIVTWQTSGHVRKRARWPTVVRALPPVARVAGLAIASIGLAAALALTITKSGAERNETATAPSMPSTAETPQLVTPDVDLTMFRDFIREAGDAARDVTPNVLLLQVDVNILPPPGTPRPGGNAGPFSFRFTDLTRTLEIYVVGPNAAPGTSKWRVQTLPSVGGPNTTIALDLTRLQTGPSQATAAFLRQAPSGTIGFGLTLFSQDIQATPFLQPPSLLWAAFGSLQTGTIRCEMTDSMGPLQVSCLPYPMVPPTVATATP
jgi:hypothetical protein